MELAIFGAVAAACTLSAELLRLSRSLRKMVRSIQYARHDIRKTADEMNMFAELFETFLDISFDGPTSGTSCPSSPTALIAWVTNATIGLRKLLERVRALYPDARDKYSLVETITAHVKWHFSKASVKSFRASLKVARETINGFTNIRCIEKLEEQLKILKRAIREGMTKKLEEALGVPVVERIKILEQTIQNRRRLWREIDKRLQNAKEKVIVSQGETQNRDFSLDTDTLLKFTESVERYVESVLPPRAPGSRTRHPDHLSHDYEPKTESVRRNFERLSPFRNGPSIVIRPNGAKSERFWQSTYPRTGSEEWSGPLDGVNAPSSYSTRNHLSPSVTGLSLFPSISSLSVPGLAFSKAAESTSDRGRKRGKSAYRRIPASEYINDPDGTLLSPPKRRSRFPSTDPKSIGRRKGEQNVEGQKADVNSTSDGLIKPFNRPQKTPESEAQDRGRSDVRVEDEDITDYEEKEGSESGFEPEEETIDERPSPFQPVAGFMGRFPPRWHQRHNRYKSPDGY